MEVPGTVALPMNDRLLSAVTGFILFSVTYLLIFGWRLKVLDLSVATAIVLALFAAIRCFVDLRIAPVLLHVSTIFLLILSYLSVVGIINGVELSPIVAEFGKPLLYLFSAAGLVALYSWKYKRECATYLLRDVLINIAITAFLVLFLFVSPKLRVTLYSLVDLYIFTDRDPESFVNRVTDLSIGGSTLSMVFLFAAVMLKDLSTFRIHDSDILRILLAVPILIAGLLSGRTGFYLMVLYFIYLLFYGVIRLPIRTASISMKILLITALFLPLPILFVGVEVSESFVKNILPWAFEAIYSYLDGYGLQTKTGEYLLSQYVLPQTLASFIFGGATYNVEWDSLFIKVWHAGGLVGVFLVVMIWIYIGALIIKREHHDGLALHYLLIYATIVFVANIKETLVGNGRGAFIIFCVLLILAGIRKEDFSKSLRDRI